MNDSETEAVEVTREVLRAMPLPRPREDDDKEARGRVLVVGGGPETPGATLLAATAALRAGAGKLQVTASDAARAAALGVALPEARVLSLDRGRRADAFDECFRKADAVCVGPGWTDEREHGPLEKLLSEETRAALVFDSKAVAAYVASALAGAFGNRAVLTPNAEEMSEVLKAAGVDAPDGPLAAARLLAARLRAVVVAKARETFVVAPDGRAFVNRAGNVGLATSGSGDVLAGLVAGLAARGADAATAAVWGVHAHAVAGDILASRVAPLGFLARELADVLPRVLWELSAGETPAAGGDAR
ncbi:MAG TPA: NAD(P)H-hydrate dehydratase [Pyrinomonadaceae bacterium]|nr:NAD(P)H-hydrate dehydratase [Pyrinomonadaceae bacterium]